MWMTAVKLANPLGGESNGFATSDIVAMHIIAVQCNLV
jgi:hypothetical protein